MRIPALATALTLVLASPAVAQTIAPILTTPDARDPHSYARPAEARVTHVALDLAADFDTHVIRGIATLDILAAPGAKQVVLDDNGLKIVNITDMAGKPLPYSVGAVDKIHGAPLTVTLNGTKKIRIAYASSPDAKALQWLTPAQTAGKKQPFLFSQGEAILNRSWIPTQDSPGIRQTWEAKIAVPKQLTAVMSGTVSPMLRGKPAPPIAAPSNTGWTSPSRRI